ncbi:MAG: hypothetical protein K8H88_24865 [Sandaracinaceae bacterium]|nr:hypothetical protein [Sandaracinaceae bacterium]
MLRPLVLSGLVLVSLPVQAQRGAQQGQRSAGRSLGDPAGPAYTEPAYDAPVPEPTTTGAQGGAAWGPEQEGEPAADTTVAVLSHALDASFLSLGSRSGPSWTSVLLSMVSGAAAIGFGVGFAVEGPPYSDLAPYFVVIGATTIARAIVTDLILRPDARGPAIAYQNMSTASAADRLERLRYGEGQLAALADWSLAARVVDASLNIASALAVIPAYLLPKDLSTFHPLEAFIFVGPAITLIAGIVTLATQSEAEQRWSAYRRLRQRFEIARSPASEFSLQLAAAPLPGGGAMLASGRF